MGFEYQGAGTMRQTENSQGTIVHTCYLESFEFELNGEK